MEPRVTLNTFAWIAIISFVGAPVTFYYFYVLSDPTVSGANVVFLFVPMGLLVVSLFFGAIALMKRNMSEMGQVLIVGMLPISIFGLLGVVFLFWSGLAFWNALMTW